ncbi:MAG: hypothetical protein AAF547_09945 [Actinomycetota bacterium]
MAGTPLPCDPLRCAPSMEDLCRYIDGQLDAKRQAKLRSQLEACGACDDAYRFQAGLQQLLGQRCRSEMPSDLSTRIFRAIGKQP